AARRARSPPPRRCRVVGRRGGGGCPAGPGHRRRRQDGAVLGPCHRRGPRWPADRPHWRGVVGVPWGQAEGRPVLATGGYDGTVRLWELFEEQLVSLPPYRSDAEGEPDRLTRGPEAAALAGLVTGPAARAAV